MFSNMMNHIITYNYSVRSALATIIPTFVIVNVPGCYKCCKNGKIRHKSNCVLEKLKLVVIAVLFWAWLATHELNGPAMLCLCATLNLGNISLSCF